MIINMLMTQIIGCGAAGGKCVAQAINDGIISEESCLIVNSTLQDKPDVNCNFINIGKHDELGGAAKNPRVGYELCTEAFKNNGLGDSLKEFAKPTSKKMYIITSLEGGTGCGSSIVIAQYVNKVLGIPVHIMAITGFEDDPRGLENTVYFFKHIEPEYTVSIISNKKFIKEANGDKLRAEQMCNREISIIISVLNGQMIVPSSKNIDDNDLFKLSTKAGFMNICYAQINERIRNMEQFNSFVKDMIDNSKSMDITDPKQTTLGVIINMSGDEQQYIDYDFKVLTDHYNSGNSTCYEIFTHIQNDTGKVNFVAFINAGMQLPLEEVQRIYTDYKLKKANSEREANEKKNEFFSGMDAMVLDDEEEDSHDTISDDEFLKSLGGVTAVKSKNNSNKKINDNF